MNNSYVKRIVIIALLIAVDIILTRFFSMPIPPVAPVMRLSFGFIAIAVTAMLFGPLYAGIGAAIADFIGIMLFPTAGASFFPGFTLTALLTGMVFGFFLHKQPVKFWRICAAAAIVTICLNLILDTAWLVLFFNQGVIAIIPWRIARTLIMLPLQIGCIHFITNERFKFIFNMYGDKS